MIFMDMNEKKKDINEAVNEAVDKAVNESENHTLSENWPEESVQDILDYIEEQGIYIRE